MIPVLRWIDSTKQYFKHVKVLEESDNWLETALRNARLQKTVRCLLMTGDTVPTEGKLLQLLFAEKSHVVVAPLFRSIDGSSNIDDPSEDLLERKNVREEVCRDLRILSSGVFRLFLFLYHSPSTCRQWTRPT